MKSEQQQNLAFCAGILLLAFIFRAHAIETLPPFNDESLHIRRAEQVLVDRDISLTPFKLLVYYWIALFRPDRLHAIFIGRTAVALFSLIGLAGTYATTRLLFGRWAAWLALVIAAFSPFMIFFDRLLLADSLTAVLGILLVWMSVRMVRQAGCGRHCPEAALTGMIGTLVILAKTIGAPFLAMPVLAVLVFGEGKPPPRLSFGVLCQWAITRLRTYQAPLLTALTVFAATMLPFTLHVIERTATGKYVMIVNNNLVLGLAENRPPHEVVLHNLATLWNVNWILHGCFFWLVMLAAASVLVRYRLREGVYLVGAVVLPWGMSIFLSAALSTRYLTLGILPLFVLVAGGLQVITEKMFAIGGHERWAKSLAIVVVGAWCLLFCWPFINHTWTDPTQLHLPQRDQWEYFENFSSGYGLLTAAKDIERLPASEPSGRVNVFGLVGSCHQLRLYLHGAENEDHGAIWLTCPFFGWRGEFLQNVAAEIDQRLAVESRVYLLAEPEIPFFDLQDLAARWHWQEIAHYSRPFDGMEIVLYHITPLENPPLNENNGTLAKPSAQDSRWNEFSHPRSNHSAKGCAVLPISCP